MPWPSMDSLPEPSPDGICCECKSDPHATKRYDAVTKDGRYCRKHLAKVVRRLSPGPTRNYPAEPGMNGRSSGIHIIQRAERTTNKHYRELCDEGVIENAFRAMEGD